MHFDIGLKRLNNLLTPPPLPGLHLLKMCYLSTLTVHI